MRVAGQSAQAGPAAGRAPAAEVGPFAQVGLAQNDGPGRPQPPDQEGIRPRPVALQGDRTGGGRHPIVGLDIVFEQDGDPVERSAQPPLPALAVPSGGGLHGLRVELEHGVDLGPGPVEGLDPIQVTLDQRARGQLPCGHGGRLLLDAGVDHGTPPPTIIADTTLGVGATG